MIFRRHFGFSFNECRVATSQHTSNKPGPDRIDNFTLFSKKQTYANAHTPKPYSHITPQTPSTSVLLCCFNIVLPFKHQVGLNVLWHKRRKKRTKNFTKCICARYRAVERKISKIWKTVLLKRIISRQKRKAKEKNYSSDFISRIYPRISRNEAPSLYLFSA